MAEWKARIDLTNLPLRPRQLKHDELQNVFGGCYGYRNVCINDSDCCSRMCRPNWANLPTSPVVDVIVCFCV